MSQPKTIPPAPAPVLIDTVKVCAGKNSGVYLECSVQGRKAYFPVETDIARRLAAELVYFATIVDTRDRK